MDIKIYRYTKKTQYKNYFRDYNAWYNYTKPTKLGFWLWRNIALNFTFTLGASLDQLSKHNTLRKFIKYIQDETRMLSCKNNKMT